MKGATFLLGERKRLPERAGKARLHFVKDSKGNFMPRRKGVDIFLPRYEEAEFCPLKGGIQFVFEFWGKWDTMRHEREYYGFFGGTEKNPFLVRLSRGPTFGLNFLKEGPRAFYEALRPKIISEWAERFGTLPRRQGDIWALPLPFSWEQICSMMFLVGAKRDFPEIKKTMGSSLFGTRHRLKGLLYEVIITNPYDTKYTMGEGVITAPDHSPFEIKGGPHILAQTCYLHAPEEAD